MSARKFAYSRVDTDSGAAYLLVTNDELAVALVGKYEEDGSLERTTPTGRTSVVRGERWGYRFLDDREVDLVRDGSGHITGVGRLHAGVFLTGGPWSHTMGGPFDTRREAFDAVATSRAEYRR